MTAQELGAFMAAHPLETVLAAIGLNMLGVMLVGWVATKLNRGDGS